MAFGYQSSSTNNIESCCEEYLKTVYKMKLFVAVVCLFAVAQTAKLGKSDEPVAIVSSNFEEEADGSYKFDFETADGTKVQQVGEQKQIGEEKGSVSKGSYSYTAPDGVVITVNWVADENGFQATGDHLPTPPPMPEHVVKLLADLKAAGVL